ncbi:MAG TPA: peptidoglycan DD-metalloendopeptidase family protein [Candidatus Polarisedimenticolaceae bacterium]
MRTALAAMLAALALGRAWGADADPPRLRAMRGEIERLRGELAELRTRESGLLGEVTRLSAELRLKQAEAEEAFARLSENELRLAERDAEVTRLETALAQRLGYLRFRLREIYKAGPHGAISRTLNTSGDVVAAVRYATWLGERDARRLREYRELRTRAAAEREALASERVALAALRLETDAARRALESTRAERARLLDSIRSDREKHQAALGELEGASREIGRLVAELGRDAPTPRLNVAKFRGLLDWPAPGRVAVPFGPRIHPKFKTTVPHPGVELAANEGDDIRAVFEGRVLYAANLQGYGLTAILDHGAGVVSIYAHASVLLVSKGQDVGRGERIGKVGDSGSLEGPGLYFEIREAGKPVDPGVWLRRR